MYIHPKLVVAIGDITFSIGNTMEWNDVEVYKSYKRMTEENYVAKKNVI